MTDPGLLSRYGLSLSQVHHGGSRSPSKSTRRPASTGALGQGLHSTSRASSATDLRRPNTAPVPGSTPGSRAKGPADSLTIASAECLSVKDLVRVTQTRSGDTPKNAERAEACSVLQPPRPGMQLRRRRRRPPGQRRRNATAMSRRLGEVAPSENSLWADAQGTSSESESGSCSERDEEDNSPHKSTSGIKAEAAAIVGASAAVTALAQQGEAARKREKNPFVEYEDREMRLQNERRWLQEDSVYLSERRKELRHNNVQRHLDVRTIPDHTLFENAVIFNQYSHYIRTTANLKEELRRHREETGPLRELAEPKIQRLKAQKAAFAQKKQVEPGDAKQKERGLAAPSIRNVQGLQQRLEDSHDTMRRTSEQLHETNQWQNQWQVMSATSAKTMKAKAQAKRRP